jgi:hypothetical protein
MDPIKTDFADRGVEFLAVNIYDDLENARSFIDNSQWDYSWVRADDGVIETLGIKGVPLLIIVDREGTVTWHSSPFTPFRGGSDLRRALEKATRG